MSRVVTILAYFHGLLAFISGASGADPDWYKHNSINQYNGFGKHRSITNCQEKPLEVRERNADVIFTGTIRDLEPMPERPGIYKSKVEIKRVMKGGYVLSRLPRIQSSGGAPAENRRLVLVEGINDPDICQSSARVLDTRIFLVSKGANGELRLNSSFVRMTLDNIEKTETVIKEMQGFKADKIRYIDKTYKDDNRQKIVHIPSDPCKHHICSFGSVCEVNRLTSVATCKCLQRCDGSAGLAGTPVCGSDGVTYDSECYLQLAVCNLKKHIQVQMHKPCEMEDPCKKVQCSFGARCVPSLDGHTSRCVCPSRCDTFGDSAESEPVCGTDGFDYPNTCEMKKKSCVDMKEIEKRYAGRCDPCEGFDCGSDRVCQLDTNRKPVCQCGALCPMVFDPVCGSDGKTYSNECIMKEDACKHMTDIWILYRGECSTGQNPCSGTICGPYEHCQVDHSNAAYCTCPSVCMPIMKPVCGIDGKTYDSECHLRRLSCIAKRHVAIRHYGECDIMNSCINYKCPFDAKCVIKNEQPVCVCSPCNEEYKPVCGSNSISYTNECKLKYDNCVMVKNTTVRYNGFCNDCEKRKCDFYSVCESDNRGGSQCICPQNCKDEDENKVCGTDGMTYNSICDLRLKSCQLQQPIMVSSHGSCDLCATVKCHHGAKCEMGKCSCKFDCVKLNEPVCASDGNSYPNECLMRRAGCSQETNIEVVHPGDCEESSGSGADAPSFSGVCEASNCQFGGVCLPNSNGVMHCICSFNCVAIRSPVCSSDGKLYGNECQMREEACRKQSPLTTQPMDNCEDIYEELCDGKPPLINPLTGKEYSCNDGKVACPAGSYCHKQGSTGRCCHEDQPIKSCADSKFGCCPDGTTSAPGRKNKGCPSVCQCNVLGSNSTTCDPGTQQCTCKPGVGGIKCDRCHPNFWGLPKISEGNNGCIPCNCNIYGSLREDCEQMTGRCICRPGIAGQKCNFCSNGKRLGPNGCTDLMLNDNLVQPRVCSEKQCHFGAVCQISNGIAACICPVRCQTSNEEPATMVCGTDGQTYGSACQLKLFACRLQKEISLADFGPCQKTTTTPVITTISTVKPRKLTMSKVRITKDLADSTSNAISDYGMLGDFCEDDQDCYVGLSFCRNGICSCKNSLIPSLDNMMCTSTGFVIPSFSGQSYVQLKKLTHGSRDLAIEIQFQSQREDGILFYVGQNADGKGDFVSLAIKKGYVEFRYDLGSGAALLRTAEKIKLNMFHKVTAVRFGKDGVLKMDDGPEVSGVSQGMLRSLNLNTPVYLGYVENKTSLIMKNIGVQSGFVGCIELLSIKTSEMTTVYDLNYDSSLDIEKQVNIKECGISSCNSLPCHHGGTCVEFDEGANYKCKCPEGFSGTHCQQKVVVHRPCLSNPCRNGGTCIALENGNFQCKCRPGREGKQCEKDAKRHARHTSVTVPQFHGNSFMTAKFCENYSQPLSLEIWFLPFESNGTMVYSDWNNSISGNFFTINLSNGFVQLLFSAGNEKVNMTSRKRVRLGEWNKVLVSLNSKNLLLALNNDTIKGHSLKMWKEQKFLAHLHVGGYPESSGLTKNGKTGFKGVVQRIYCNNELIKNMFDKSVEHMYISEYDGPPCPVDFNPCQNHGKCIPNMSDFQCQCPDEFTGSTCEVKSALHRSIYFNGDIYYNYNNGISMQNRSQERNKIEIRFQTNKHDGLLLLMRKSSSTADDYLAIAVDDGRVQASFNLGKQNKSKLLKMTSLTNVADNQWHDLVFIRNKQRARLFVDDEHSMVNSVATSDATHLDTDGLLWIGGSEVELDGLPASYRSGFAGCVGSVKLQEQELDLDRDRIHRGDVTFCDHVVRRVG